LPPQPDTNTATTAAAAQTDGRHTPLLVLTITHNPQPLCDNQKNLRSSSELGSVAAMLLVPQNAETQSTRCGTQRFNTPRKTSHTPPHLHLYEEKKPSAGLMSSGTGDGQADIAEMADCAHSTIGPSCAQRNLSSHSKIGRASCRERVEISVGGVDVK